MPNPPRVTVHCVGNAHLDPVWRWSWQEGYGETLATCRAAVDRLRESSDFVFSRGEAGTFAWIEEADPALFEEIRRYVREGRWSVIGGFWEQPDCNLPGGESFVRQALYGKRWLREKLGVDVRSGWSPDAFGHNGGLPQILARSGYDAYCFFRPGPDEMPLPAPLFWWEGPDGSRILAIRPPAGHYAAWQDDLGDLVREAAAHAAALGLQHILVCYGIGNHGGGPSRRAIASLRALRDDPDEPNAIFGTLDDFVAAVRPDAQRFPTVRGDLQHHARGCYTTHSETKRSNRLAETRLAAAARGGALAAGARGRRPAADSTADLARAWRQVLFNQFHDTLAGTSLPAAYEDARHRWGEALAIAERLQNAALQALAARIDTRVVAGDASPGGGRPILLFNPSSWARTEPVTIQWGWPGAPADRLVDECGADVPFQAAQPDVFPAAQRIHFEATLPAHGYRVYRFVPGDPAGGRPALGEPPRAGERSLENRFYALEFDAESGALVRLYDKRSAVEGFHAPACALVVLDDPGDTWGHGIAAWRDEVGRFGGASLRVVERGESRATLRIDTSWGRSRARQEFTLYRDTPRIDVTLGLDWQEPHRMLKLSVPVAVRDATVTCDGPYCVQVRAANGCEEPMQAWVDLSGRAVATDGRDTSWGLSLLNDGKYGFDCLGTDLRMSLVRSPIYCFHDPAQPDPDGEYLYVDLGRHEIRYALLPHAGSWQDAATVRHARALGEPFVNVFQYPHPPHRGPWSAAAALLAVEPPHVLAVAMKGAEDGEAAILRLYESQGSGGRATVSLPGDRVIETRIGPFELKTLRIEPDGRVREVDLLEGS
jgi:alpha-mannosidase